MKPTRFIFISLLLLSLCACAHPTRTPEQQAFENQLLNRPVTCKSAEDCDEKWNKAIEWVVTHTQRGIRKITPTTILTNADKEGNESFTEYEVVRYKAGDEYVFSFRSECDTLNCGSDVGAFRKIDFINHVMGLPPGVIQTGPDQYEKAPLR